ncbi:MAG: nucleoside diphosphate kinase regulator [Sterolibacteriaceae bacterium]|nr:nucleoside diphosphate kinase regulator [Sterolibacteriaceae bacterium]MBK9087294.1 nucleoside diphosphate kinase regulator [Sterolibacteriaceae bacterium]
MSQRQIFITSFDLERLEELIAVAIEFRDHSRKDLDALEEELSQAEVVEPQKMPPDVVTMNSKAVLRDLDTSKEMVYRLVFPKDADIDSGAISVLAPVGTAILGYREGDVIEWPVPSGKRRIKVEKILYQPEAAKDFHL